jgi:hypothetical protein
MTWYATLADAKNELKAGTTANATEDPIIADKVRLASRRADAQFRSRRPFFAPYSETRAWLVEGQRVDSFLRLFHFSDPLLALSSVVVGTTTLTVGTTVEAWRRSPDRPFKAIRLMNSSDDWYQYCNSDDPVLATIGGFWGYHPDWANAWDSVDTVADNPLSAAATSLTVADVDGADGWGFTPRISQGSLLRIEDEYLEVTATNTTTNVATVIRGVNGTTAAAHVQTTAVEAFRVYDPVRRAVARQAAFLYARRGAYESSSVQDLTVVNFPNDLLAEFRDIMQELAYE